LKDYELKKWHHDIDKPFVVGIHKDIKPRHYMDPMLKSKKLVPAPNAYQISRELTSKQNIINQKGPRDTMPTVIEKYQKKFKLPEPATYKPNFSSTESRLLGCFKFKSDR
jgi:hypothetical protein